MTELGDKVTSEERLAVESAVSDLKSALEGDDKDKIEAKTSALAEASAALAQRLYAEQQAEGDAGRKALLDAAPTTASLMPSSKRWTRTTIKKSA